MPRPAAPPSGRPFLAKNQRLTQERTRVLIHKLRAHAGDEIFVRSYKGEASGPAASRLREALGPDFYVRRSGGDVYARARKVGEPPMRKQKLRLGGEWTTIKLAAEQLGITQQWLRAEYINRAKLTTYKFGTRVVLRAADVDAIDKQRRAQHSGLFGKVQ